MDVEKLGSIESYHCINESMRPVMNQSTSSMDKQCSPRASGWRLGHFEIDLVALDQKVEEQRGMLLRLFHGPNFFEGLYFENEPHLDHLHVLSIFFEEVFPDDCRCLAFSRLSLTFGKDQLPQRLVSNFFTPSEAKYNLVLRREKLN